MISVEKDNLKKEEDKMSKNRMEEKRRETLSTVKDVSKN